MNDMYERMLVKDKKPSVETMTAYCGDTAKMFTKLNEWLSTEYGTTQAYPCGNGGWIHYRVTCKEQFADITSLLSVKCGNVHG